jgi:hypothetical protein
MSELTNEGTFEVSAQFQAVRVPLPALGDIEETAIVQFIEAVESERRVLAIEGIIDEQLVRDRVTHRSGRTDERFEQ